MFSKITGADASLIYIHMLGFLDVNSIGVGAALWGVDGEVGNINPLRSLNGNVHLWAVFKS